MKLAPTYAALAAALVGAVSAAPTLQPRLNDLGLEWMGNSSLPKVLFLYTGGTISGGSDLGRLDTTTYGQLGRVGEEILAQVPEILDVAQIAVSNWTGPGGSTGTNDERVMNMTRFAHKALCSEYSDIAGAVFTHGTNSLEETLFLGDLLINCGKPYVGLGAMRPWSALSFDGDANLFAGIALAASPEARNRGAMVAFNDRIVPGYWVTKTNANTPDTFKAYEQGYLGTFINNLPYFFNTASEPTGKLKFDIDTVSAHSSYPSLPKVDIHYAMREFDGQLVLDSLKNGADGVVIAGTGSGSVVTGTAGTLEAMEEGLIVAVSTRSPNGAATPERVPRWAKTGYLHPIQARIALQLMIASGYGQNQTNAAFEDPIREATNQIWEY